MLKSRGVNMELFYFGILCGMIVAIIFISGGAIYAKHNDNQSMDERTNVSNNSKLSDVCNGDRCRSCNSTDNEQSVNQKIDFLYIDGKITDEYAASVLEAMLFFMKTLSRTEKDSIERGIEVLRERK